MARKTIDIDDLKARINDKLLHTVDNYTDGRLALAHLLSQILHDAGQYRGFSHLTEDMMAFSDSGRTVGITNDGQHGDDTDDTRIYFH